MSVLSLEAVLYTGAIGLVAIGAVGLVMSNHLFRMLLALAVAEAGGNVLIVLAGFREGAVAPILGIADGSTPMVDPVPQALVLTAIVIGFAVQAFALVLVKRAHRAVDSDDMDSLRSTDEQS
jgi:multicomponent Na+:H+ antiporter subunit C